MPLPPPRATWLRTPRPLPWAITAMTLLLVVKLVGLSGFAVGPGVIAPARASNEHPPPASPTPAKAPSVPPQAAAPPAPTPSELAAAAAERSLLQDLRARRTALDERTRTLEAREAVLAAAERRMDQRVTELAALQTRLEALDRTRRDRDEANWRGLVKTYETMRPRDAAAIFNDLEQSVLMQVLDRMKEAKAAPILAAMQPERARAATAELAQWRLRAAAPDPAAPAPAPGGKG